jgi:AraC family transcriptional regulator, regulatory protein of adaptative response / methylated-DNA-[protein]-cysteine methyltransferase
MSSVPQTEARRWRAVASRSLDADGRFVYAVTSTGVYCRPSCPSRRPRPDRVRFFATSAEAEQAGYRACLRCRPAGARPVSVATRAVVRAANYLRTHAAGPVALADLARHVGMSPSHLQRVFMAHTGVSPREFQAACRAERFRGALRAGSDVTTATYEAGYGSPSRVSQHKPTGRGLAPAAYRRGAPGVVIRYSVLDSPLGRMLVAATDKGVCAVKLGAADAPLVDELRREFPRAEIRASVPGGSDPSPGSLAPARKGSDPFQGGARKATVPSWARAIAAAIRRRPAVTPDVPLDVQGTAFQWLVWKALQEIPAGATRSYAAVAGAIGRPRAVRAVARACAMNPVALVVPCHRVVPASGGSGGYRWGTERKAALLAREARG